MTKPYSTEEIEAMFTEWEYEPVPSMMTEFKTKVLLMLSQLLTEKKEAERLPNPLMIPFGEGRINIRQFDNGNEYGVMFEDTGVQHVIGELGDEPAEADHQPQKGEIYLSFTNIESLQVLIEELQTVHAKAKEKP